MKIAYRAIAAAACLSLLAACSGDGEDGRTAAANASTTPNGSASTPVDPAGTATASPSPSPTRRPADQVRPSERWKDVDGAELRTASGLTDVIATGPREAWALGFEEGAEDDEGRPTLVRWNGVTWSKVRVGDDFGNAGFDVTGPDDLWAVGGDTVAHWDGRRWTGERPFGISEDKSFTDVSSDGDRAVLIGSDGPKSFIVTGRRGTYELATWERESMLKAVTSRAGHTWIVGAKPRPKCRGVAPVIVHRGKAADAGWDEMRVPDIPGGTLTSVVQISPTDVWAAGKIAKTGRAEPLPDESCPESVYAPPEEAGEVEPAATPLVMHWDGRSWQRMELPAMSGSLRSVTAFGPDDVWVAGSDGEREHNLFLHFDGRAWSKEYAFGTPVKAIAAIPGTKDLWAVGAANEWTDSGKEFILRRDGRGRPGRARS